MIIVISGSVGSGKTTIADKLAEKMNCEILHLNEYAEKYKTNYVQKLETFDFDIDLLLDEIEEKLKDYKKSEKNIILESHFAHFINCKMPDYLFIINRDLKLLKKEYINRKYPKEKISGNLEVESFNLCFYEAIENGYENLPEKIFCIDNNNSIESVIEKIMKILFTNKKNL